MLTVVFTVPIVVPRVPITRYGVAVGYRFAERRDRIGDLDLDVAVHQPQVVQRAVEVQLSRAEHDVLARLLHLSIPPRHLGHW